MIAGYRKTDFAKDQIHLQRCESVKYRGFEYNFLKILPHFLRNYL